MNENQSMINQLLSRLEILEKKQESFSNDVEAIRKELFVLKNQEKEIVRQELESEETELAEMLHENLELVTAKGPVIEQPTISEPVNKPIVTSKESKRHNLEEFIGENLISKIGIIITVIGVAIGARYAIEHEMISPLTRIILGYLFGLGMLATGAYLKKNYFNFSAVLVSGALAIMYFITYAAYDFYGLIPQVLTFVMMVVFTIFTVAASLHYDRQIIALIGLVGAYSVPFLLSDGSGRVMVLFSYMVIVNIGILVIAFHKYWKPLFHSSFIFTWLIYAVWFFTQYNSQKHLGLAFGFLCVFFVVFYVMFLACKLLQKEKINVSDVILILSNSFLFYGFGYAIMLDITNGDKYLGLFTLGNALIHFVATAVIFRNNLGTRNLFYFISGLVLTFLTIAIPVQLNGNWVTLLWAGEAALLFWIGRTKGISVYEKLSYLLMLLAFFSILHDWTMVYDYYSPDYPETRVVFLFNIHFLTSLLFLGAFAFINLLHRNPNYSSAFDNRKSWKSIASFIMPAILIVTLYYALRIEISTYWNQLFTDSSITINTEGEEYPNYFYNYDLREFKNIWIVNYSLLFFAVLSFINVRKIRSVVLGYIGLVVNIILVLVFLSGSLYLFSELRQSYLEQDLAEYYRRGIMHITIRYISFLFYGAFIASFYQLIKGNIIKEDLQVQFFLLMHVAMLWIASSEVIHWMDMAGSTQSYKLGLSILWGVYALLMVVLGIWKKAPYLRYSAIVLFGVTLIKLFFYDIAHLDAIAKTIVFVSLGLLMLVISFLYNKYRNLILEEERL